MEGDKAMESTNNLSDARMMRGLAISEQGKIAENGDGSFSVPSQTKEDLTYKVSLLHNEWICNCPDFTYRHINCKHIYATKFWITLKTYIQNEPKPKIFTSDAIPCSRCGSIRVMKYGHSSNKQVFKCRDCGKKFREESLIKKARYDPEIITVTLDLYFKGISLRKISDHLKQFYGIEVPFQTVWKWLDRYIKIMDSYVKTLVPQLSGKWHVDEMMVKVKNGFNVKGDKGKWLWLWNVLDRDTKFQLASEISRTKNELDGMKVFSYAKEIAKSIPKTVITDKMGSYPKIMDRAFLSVNREQRPQHIRVLGGAGQRNGNQYVERLHNTIRERNKVQRGWKKEDTPLKSGQMLYYNFIRPHMTLDGKTPAQVAGINVTNSQNKWMELLRKALATQK